MPQRSIILLALGPAGLAAAGMLKKDMEESVDIVEAEGGELDLGGLLKGYESALILGSVETGGRTGTVLEFSTENGPSVLAPVPYGLRLPEIRGMAHRPARTAVLVIEISGTDHLSPAVEQALPFFAKRAKQILEGWQDLECCTPQPPDLRERPARL
jgi:Ni,Fe-hydrogenase maturation factor